MSVAKGERVGLVDKTKRLYRGVTQELKKVHWPNRKELVTYTLVVLASVLIVGVALWVIDAIVGTLMNGIIK